VTKHKHLITPLLLALTLSACGGGSSDSADSASLEDQFLARGGIPGKPGKSTPVPTEPAPIEPTPTEPTPTEPTPTAPDSSLTTYSTVVNGIKRTFNFDGSAPFVNSSTGQPDIRGWLYNGIEGSAVTNAGVAPWIQKMTESGMQVTRFQVFSSDNQLYGWRSQADSYPFENYKHYRYDLEFKLDPNWNFNMSNGDGLLWQAKGQPKSGQFSNASLSIGLGGDNLYFALLYPQSALNATTWPTRVYWTNSQYAPTNFPARKIVAGKYYKVRMEFFADDRPNQFGGQGYMNVWLDDQLWIQHKGPNLHPDQAGPHRFDHGWYAWGGQPSSTRTVFFKQSHAYVK
jgi:hypothetical protein